MSCASGCTNVVVLDSIGYLQPVSAALDDDKVTGSGFVDDDPNGPPEPLFVRQVPDRAAKDDAFVLGNMFGPPFRDIHVACDCGQPMAICLEHRHSLASPIGYGHSIAVGIAGTSPPGRRELGFQVIAPSSRSRRGGQVRKQLDPSRLLDLE
jgi:hypothetical protein